MPVNSFRPQTLIVFSLLFMMSYPIQSSAFLNIESLRQNKKTGFYGATGAKAAGSSGNTEKFTTSLASQNIYKSKNHEFIFTANYTYGEAFNKKNAHKGSLHLRYTRKLTPTYAHEIFGQSEFNEFTALLLRSLGGTGLRIRLIEEKQKSLYFGAGLFYEHEQLKTDADQKTVRGNIYLSYRMLLDSGAEAIFTTYYQPSFKSKDDYRIQLDTGIELPITKQLTFAANLQVSHDTRPPTGIQNTDTSYMTGLNYSY